MWSHRIGRKACTAEWVSAVAQHDLTPRIYVLRKITTALKFMSYINQRLRPSYQTALNLHILKISGRSARERAEQPATGGDTERGINIFQFFFVY